MRLTCSLVVRDPFGSENLSGSLYAPLIMILAYGLLLLNVAPWCFKLELSYDLGAWLRVLWLTVICSAGGRALS